MNKVHKEYLKNLDLMKGLTTDPFTQASVANLMTIQNLVKPYLTRKRDDNDAQDE